MSEAVEIRRFTTEYRLRPSQYDQSRRLDGLVPQVTGAMEVALERAGVRFNEVICIRSLHLPVRLRLSRSDSALVAEWANLLAAALAEAASDPHRAVRYGSRSLALAGMGADISQRHLERLWAWRQAGLWQGSIEAVSVAGAAIEFANALVREPELAVPALVSLASIGRLRALAPYWEDAWVEIAMAVLTASGAAVETIVSYIVDLIDLAPPGPPSLEEQAPERSSQVLRRAARIIERSRILADCRTIQFPAPAFRAMAALAILESEPAMVRASSAEFIELLRAISGQISEGATPLPPAGSRPPATRPRFAPEVVVPEPPVAREPEPYEPALRPRQYEPEHYEPALEWKPEEPVTILRREAFTAFGGLLFLLRLEDEAGIPERAMASPIIAARGLAWFQHRLAIELQPIEPGDPAALAFCGLAPESEHPSLDQPVPSREEQEFVDGCARELRTALAEVLGEPAADPARLLQFVCRRTARIVADPGWIEVRLALDDVSIEIRRAGLDLDPNFVPWLGVVVRFVYE